MCNPLTLGGGRRRAERMNDDDNRPNRPYEAPNVRLIGPVSDLTKGGGDPLVADLVASSTL